MNSTPIAQAAFRLWGNSVPILTFETLKSEARDAVSAIFPDILVSFAYGRIFGPRFMGIFPKGGINVHPSLLPRWRGSSPIPHSIMFMDKETGISIQTIAPEMDTGELLHVHRIPLNGRETSASLSELCAQLAGPMVVKVLDEIEKGIAKPRPQIGEPTYCRKIVKEDGHIDWHRPSCEIDARIRAFDPWPGSFTFLRDLRLFILEAEPFDDFKPMSNAGYMTNLSPGTIIATVVPKGIIVRAGNGYIAIKRLQVATRKAIGFQEFSHGARDIIGAVLR
jgi:methionyl-tRNA formyltransferase